MNSAVVGVDPSNQEQAKAWDGEEGEYWAAHAEHFDRSVARYHQSFMNAAAIEATDRVLDVGCGTGQTTRYAARVAQVSSALGVDLSSRMIDLARRLATSEGVTNASFEQTDAQIHPFVAESFDVAISRTGAMFFGDSAAAFTNIARALHPGGRLALLAWQPLVANEWIKEFSIALAAGRQLPTPPPDAPGPFALSDPDRVRAVLTSAGFTAIELDARREAMWFGDDADDAHRFVLGLMGWMLHGLDERGRARAIDALDATLAGHATSDGVLYESATWTVRATRA
jgi:SAM-dependent methyltransferase